MSGADDRIAALEKAIGARLELLEARDAARNQRAAAGGFLTAPADGIHEAGVLVDGLQLCRRCSGVLSDYRGAMQLSSDPPLTGYPMGAFVEVSGPGSWVTDAAPTCGAPAPAKSVADQKIDRIVGEAAAETERGRQARREP